MAWIMDTYASTMPPHERQRALPVVTGKPIETGGSLGRDKATGQGVVYCIEEWARDRNVDLSSTTYTVQGFGNVGSWAARLLKAHDSRMIAVEDHTGAIRRQEGIDPDALLAHVKATGGVVGFAGSEPVDHETFLRTRADIFVPAALENVLTGETAEWMDVRMIAEGANGPTNPEADRILRQRGIEVIPDILCTAGGVIVSYFEWLQNKRSEAWDLEEVDEKLHRKITSAYRRVMRTAETYGVDARTAAYIEALGALEKIYTDRGVYP